MEKSIITIAVGKKTYIDMACNLAMSFLLWNNDNKIDFYLFTDNPQFISNKLKSKINVVDISDKKLQNGFASKLYMAQLTNAEKTLFIDADCLIYGNLLPVFETFNGYEVTAIGHKLTEGKDIGFCHDVSQLLANTGIPYFPLICGSVYYFQKSDLSDKIFNYAISQLKVYKEIGLIPLRDKENEEPLIAISMAKFNQNPVEDTGKIKADRMFYDHLKTNIISGRAKLWNTNNPPVPEYSTLKLSQPLIVHFNNHFTESYEYKSEIIRLKMYYLENRGKFVANISAYIASVLPGKLKLYIKNLLRPVYVQLFGNRKIKKINRL